MHTLLAVTFPEMGEGILAVVVFGAMFVAAAAGLAMAYSAMLLWQDRKRAGRRSAARGPLRPARTQSPVRARAPAQ